MLKITSIASAGTPSKVVDNSIFLTPKAKIAFLRLKQAFTEALILHHFDLKCYIRIVINASN